MLERISNNSTNGTSIYGIYTGIVAYADDIIILSTTLSGLQKLVNICNSYGNNNFIKLNPNKTEFIASGKQQIKNCFINLSDNNIALQSKLKHLGFIWDTEKSVFASLNNININERLSQFQSITHTLVRSGIRFAHPNTIVHLFKSLVVPKLTYGLELCDINKYLLNKLDIAGNTALKSFFNISKHSRNYLQTLFNIDHISHIINRNKLNLFVRLMNNSVTSNLILTQIEHGLSKSTFTITINELCEKYDINFYNLLIQNKKIDIQCTHNELPADISVSLTYAIRFWQLKTQRENFKTILERNIPNL